MKGRKKEKNLKPQKKGKGGNIPEPSKEYRELVGIVAKPQLKCCVKGCQNPCGMSTIHLLKRKVELEEDYEGVGFTRVCEACIKKDLEWSAEKYHASIARPVHTPKGTKGTTSKEDDDNVLNVCWVNQCGSIRTFKKKFSDLNLRTGIEWEGFKEVFQQHGYINICETCFEKFKKE